MRIEVLVVSGTGPVYDAVLRLSDVTVLTGRNDSGKTRVLRAIEAALMSRPDAEELEVHGVAVPSELQAFLSDPESPPTWIIAAEAATVAPFSLVVDPLADGERMRVGLLVSPWNEDLLPGWRYGRALIDVDDATRMELEEALAEAGLDRKALDEPLKLEALGGFDPQILPEAIVVPCDAAEMDLRIAGAITRLTRALRALASVWRRVADVAGPLQDGPPPEWGSSYGPTEQPSEVKPSWEWLLDEDEETGTSHVHPAARHACAVLEGIVARLLPGFIAEDYWLRIIPGRPTGIARGRYLHVQLHLRDEGEHDAPEDSGAWFDVSDTASGFTVWLQLAFCEAVQRVKRFSYLLQQHVLALHLIAELGDEELGGITYSSEEVIGGITIGDLNDRAERIAHRLDGLGVEAHKSALEDLLAGLKDPRLALPVIPQYPIFQPDPDHDLYVNEDRGEALEPMPRGRLYLLDEPEQRLHPMLQRRAAQWLATLMSQWGAQCVITTHAVAFMDIAGDTFAYEISRTADEAKILPLDAGALTPYSQIAEEMGLDRGELLSLTRAFLITSPPVAALLQELCAEQLTNARITIIPVDASHPATDILPASLLTSLTAAPLAVLFTSINPAEIEQLRRGDAAQRVLASRSSAEASTAAALIDLSVRHGRTIEILTLNAASVLDLLDEVTIAHTATGTQPFTGHTAAHDLHRATDQTYPQFVASTYGITIDEDLIRTLARSMRSAGIPAADALTDVIWQIEQLALTTESLHRHRP